MDIQRSYSSCAATEILKDSWKKRKRVRSLKLHFGIFLKKKKKVSTRIVFNLVPSTRIVFKSTRRRTRILCVWRFIHKVNDIRWSFTDWLRVCCVQSAFRISSTDGPLPLASLSHCLWIVTFFLHVSRRSFALTQTVTHDYCPRDDFTPRV